ncbi:SGNH/GDSL hydrolase family protein [Sphingomonas sp. Leaf339]|uniref:SGNH/GDSL hydrolase family protein n=1 Tax=Sphingomonas sp. Leaf339 TaxID=1736343 RepID=UPI0009E7C161|nr:SGNH/GDSL hydrolase family protein [Sphingomonas sp. Leaf339]
MSQMNFVSRIYQIIGLATLVAMSSGCGADAAPAPSSAIAVVNVGSTSAIPSPTSTPTSAASSGSVASQTAAAGVIVQAGDSIGVGVGADDWAAIDHLGFSAGITIQNASVSGKAMQTGYGNRMTEVFPFRSSTSPSVLLIQQGTNDLYYGTNASSLYRSILTPFVSDARKAGFYVVVDTILPRSDGGWTSVMERERIAYNTLVRANRAGADAVNDLAADSVMGDGNNLNNQSFYADGAHPSLSGQQRLAILNATVLGPFLQRSPRPPSR